MKATTDLQSSLGEALYKLKIQIGKLPFHLFLTIKQVHNND